MVTILLQLEINILYLYTIHGTAGDITIFLVHYCSNYFSFFGGFKNQFGHKITIFICEIVYFYYKVTNCIIVIKKSKKNRVGTYSFVFKSLLYRCVQVLRKTTHSRYQIFLDANTQCKWFYAAVGSCLFTPTVVKVFVVILIF